tara:strand:- start:228 stop:869 length:642 start_codon:yes stop_codon:yes gene_type:complete
MATPAWQRKEGKSPSGGLNRKGIASYRRANPGSKLSMAVTTKPSKLKKGSKAAKRRRSFCARMSGVKGPMKDEKGRPTRKALALRKWNCKHGCMVRANKKSKMEKGGVTPPKGFHFMKKGEGRYKLMKHKGDFVPHEGATMKPTFPVQKKHKTKKRKYVSGGIYKKGGTNKDACYYKVVGRYGPKSTAYRSGAMAKCRKMGVRNWGEGGKKKK